MKDMKKKKNKKTMKSKLKAQKSLSMKSKNPSHDISNNPFESIWSRKKFSILGKNRKDDQKRLVGRSRSLAIQKRENTLLKEYEQSEKNTEFIDGRIGEENGGLGEYEKAVLRRQYQLKSKKAKYNLSDGSEDELGFEGEYFGERDDFEDDGGLDEEDNDGGFSASDKMITFGDAENDQGSGLPEGEKREPKTKKQVMAEIILKSKTFKAEKAKDKEENEQFLEQLDKDFVSISKSEALLSLTQPDKMKALKSLVNNSLSTDKQQKPTLAVVQEKPPLQQENPDDYNKLIGELALDMRARPSDRTKAPEELAQEEKERLEHLEEERQKRMTEDYSSNEDDDNSEDGEKPAKKQKHVSGDDLGDSFLENVNTRSEKAVWIDDLIRNGNLNEDEDVSSSGESEDDEDDDEEDEEGSEEDDDEDDKDLSVKDWEPSDDDVIDTGLEDEEKEDTSDDDDIKEDMIKNKKLSGSKVITKGSLGAEKVKTNSEKSSVKEAELPYTIEAPKTFEELNSLLENRSHDQIMEAISRIRSYNAISIAAENRKKMQVFYGVLLQYFAVSASKKPLDLKLLNMLVKPLIEISTEIPYFAAICARQRLFHIREQFSDSVKYAAGKSCCPSVKTIVLLRLWTMIFPCSDFRHAVTTPAMLLMSEYLMRCPIISGRDIAVGSFLCSMVLVVCRQSQKLCPEAITFMQTMLLAALNNKQGCENSQLYHLMEIKALRPLLRVQGHVESITPLDFLSLMDLPDDSPYFTSDSYRASIIFAIIGTLRGFVTIYQGLKSFPEMFLPISKLLRDLAEEENLPDALKVEIKDVVAIIENKSQETHLLRQPLRMQKQKIIKTEVPKFEENFIKGRDYDPDRERAAAKKLRRKVRDEKRGAVRELRKDNHYMRQVKEKKLAKAKQERDEEYGRYRAILQDQEHAYKSGQLGKGKGKKRRR